VPLNVWRNQNYVTETIPFWCTTSTSKGRAASFFGPDYITSIYAISQMSCLNFTMDPRSLFCLTGIAVRIAQRMGLNFDGTSYGLPPFEVEMRRRLWWQVHLLDLRVSELSGAGSSILNHTWTTKLPSNINDSDLFPDMREPPQDHPGATEMVFVLHRCEVTNLVQQLQDLRRGLSRSTFSTATPLFLSTW
jgi:hypothetical protein